MARTTLTALAALLLAGRALAAPAPPPELAAIPHVLLTDVGSGQTLFAKAPDTPFLPASMTKAMTAWVLFGMIDGGKLRPNTLLSVSEGTARDWAGQGTTLWLRAGEQVPVDALLRGIAVVSANDAAVALAEGTAGDVPTFLKLMNAEARRLGMASSRFASPNGLPDGGATVVTARDLVRLGIALEARYPQLYRAYFGQKSFVWRGTEYINRDPLIGVVPGADGIKTGHTLEAGYTFLGAATRGSRRLVMVLAGARSMEQRASAARALIEWGFAGWAARPLFAAGHYVTSARVQGGDARTVDLVAGRAIHASLPAGENPAVSLKVTYRGPLVAPIAKGAQVAELEISVAGQPAGRVPLHAAKAVGEAGVLDRLVNGLAGMLP